ncbi:hypothetical protein MMH89_03080 [Candidatus Comchoanobacter bicostacola]|uniref:Uncharacterized protein n=1 Tax=Candidatus Comchoanobacter bicostacola TaxID=2919598 RepID=A0ABY5DK62_9GAMM|nr:hypothetical protein [Candidatus Comchoanobacter bicostacola]UTC24205.1 hypothetical protein MMH89_03080 [Candidatus Comchoanobacter bicostacola]
MGTYASKHRANLNQSLSELKDRIKGILQNDEGFSSYFKDDFLGPLFRTMGNAILFGFFALGKIVQNVLTGKKYNNGLQEGEISRTATGIKQSATGVFKSIMNALSGGSGLGTHERRGYDSHGTPPGFKEEIKRRSVQRAEFNANSTDLKSKYNKDRSRGRKP